MEQDILLKSVADIGLKPGVSNMLIRYELTEVGIVMARGASAIRGLRWFGKKRYADLCAALDKMGLHLENEPSRECRLCNRLALTESKHCGYHYDKFRQRTAKDRQAVNEHGEPRARAYWMHRKYGLTVAAHAALLVSQGGGCAICGAKESGGRRKALHIDHDHATGKVRGLLCSNCNSMLGHAGDNPDTLKDGAIYLEKTRATGIGPTPTDQGQQAVA